LETSLASIIIPTYERRDALRRALVSLARQTESPESYEVIVSVDGSTDGTVEMLDSYQTPYTLRVVAGPKRGRAAACNEALARVQGEIVIVLDDDMQVVPEFVARHRRHHHRGSRLCVLGPVPVELDATSTHAAAYVKAKFDAHLAKLADPDHIYTARDFYSGNASLRTDVLREVGGFDDSFTVYGNEDVELSLRLRAVGVELRFDSEAIAHQEYAKDLPGLVHDTIAKGTTTVLLALRHPTVFDSLRLAMPRDNSQPWLVVRGGLLWITRRNVRASRVVVALAVFLERLGFWRWPLFYRAVLDYAFWVGVDRELRGSRGSGELDRLAAELRRGPVDLLLHR
jgi:GT2 family glycosyltransferase